MTLHHQLAGRFTLKVERLTEKGERETVREYGFDNLITNLGLNRMGAINNRTECCVSAQVGSGSAAPAFTDTQLAAFVAVQSTTTSASTSGWNPAGFHWRRFTWQFGQGAAAGNLSEVGVGTGSGAGSLWSRALILDTNGQPTTITILPTEFLTIVYELRNYPPTGDVTQTVTIDGVSRTITCRAARRESNPEVYRNNIPAINFFSDLASEYNGHTLYSGAIGAETDLPGGNAVSATVGQRTWSAYVADSYHRDCTTTYAINQGNVTGGVINSIVFAYGGGQTQMGIVPGIAKNNTQSFNITTRVSWGRFTPP